MNKIMTVYNPDGSRYFHTDTVSPERETREENFWTAMGYVVVFTESAAAQETSRGSVLSSRDSGMVDEPAPAADPAPEYWDTP